MTAMPKARNHNPSDDSLILDFLGDKELQSFAKAEDNSSVLDLLQDLIDERAFTRIIAYFLESNESHGLGDLFLKELLKATNIPLKPYERLDSTTISEWKTHESKFLDILIIIREPSKTIAGKIKLIIGLENKVFASEHEGQLSDYQRALIQSFPNSKRFLLFLTPDGRAGKTADSKKRQSCPVRVLSYQKLARVAELAATHAVATDIKLLLKAIPRYIEKHIVSEFNEGGTMRDLADRIRNSTKKKKALDLIAKNIFLPNVRSLIYEYVIRELQAKHPGAYVEWHYHRKSPAPNEFNIAFADMYKGDLGIYYQLWRRDNSSPFTIRIMAWCENRKHRKYVERMRSKIKLPKREGEIKEWGYWSCIWAGPEYKVSERDISKVQSEFFRDLLSSVIQKTHKHIATYLKRHPL